MKFDVHAYVTCRVKVWNIEASSAEHAMQVVEEQADINYHDLLPDRSSHDRPDWDRPVVEFAGYADEVTSYLVDEVGDETYERSQHCDLPSPSRIEQDLKRALQALVNFNNADPDLYLGDDDGTLGRIMSEAQRALDEAAGKQEPVSP